MMTLADARAVARKARGAYFTPVPIAEHLVRWAIRDDPDATIMDPTCGDGVFLVEAARQIRDLGASYESGRRQVIGFDIDPASVEDAHRALDTSDLAATIHVADFFSISPPSGGNQLELHGSPDSSMPAVDAVVGNPPFVRYQSHTGAARAASQSAAAAQGVRLPGLASAWAAALVHATGFLRSDGRLAMVVPAELLSVNYAQEIRDWLCRRFGSVHVILFRQLQFEDALADTVLLLAEGRGGCAEISVSEVDDFRGLATAASRRIPARSDLNAGKWTHFHLSEHQHALVSTALASFSPLRTYGRPSLGVVTGSNDYFTLTEETRVRYGLRVGQVRSISPPGTRHFRGGQFTKADWLAERDQGKRVWLFRPEPTDGSTAVKQYVALGESLGVDQAYKCRIREPWWIPPAVRVPDLFVTYMSHRFPRLISNQAGADFLNSMHGFVLKPDISPKLARTLPYLALNSLTLVCAELSGRSYGGGILKLEPREASALPVPSPTLLSDVLPAIMSRAHDLEACLRDGGWQTVIDEMDELVLRDAAGLSTTEVSQLRSTAEDLRQRRTGRVRTAS